MSRPAITLKLATSLDGRIATAAGESRWITSEAARAEVHRMRAAHDCVIVGVGTALVDDPELTARPPGGSPERQPLRVVLDARLRLSPESRIARTLAIAPALAIGATGADAGPLTAAGVEVALVAKAPEGGVDLLAALALLAARGVATAFVEGGGVLAASLARADLIERIEWFRAPILLGAEGRPALGALALARLCDAPRYSRLGVRACGPDLLETYGRAERECSRD